MRWAVLATLLAAIVVPLSTLANGQPLVALTNPGADGPSAAVYREDFPKLALPAGDGHDGQQFYAIARNPLHPDEVAPNLDRPRYRLQRIAYPLAAWLLHPTGGGTGLVVAMLAVGIAAMFVGCLATGFLSVRWGGPPWAAALFALVPGNLVALRNSTADAMALALAVAAIALAERDDSRLPMLAVLAGSVAVLSKEAVVVVLIAYAVGRWTRRTWVLAGVPLAIGGLWALWLRLVVPASGPQILEFTAPFVGIGRAAGHWLRGEERGAALILVATAILVALAVWRRRDRMTLALVGIPAAFVTFLSADATGLWGNASRVVAPAMLFGALALVAGRGTRGAPGQAESAPATPAAIGSP